MDGEDWGEEVVIERGARGWVGGFILCCNVMCVLMMDLCNGLRK